MLKFIVVCHRRTGSSREEFRRYFREVHGPLALAIPHVSRYVLSFVEPDPVEGDPQWDALVEFWCADRDAYDAAWRSPEAQRAIADNPRFLDLTKTGSAIVEEVVLRL